MADVEDEFHILGLSAALKQRMRRFITARTELKGNEVSSQSLPDGNPTHTGDREIVENAEIPASKAKAPKTDYQLVPVTADKCHMSKIPTFIRNQHQVAAYMGLKIKSDLHKLQFSAPILEAYKDWVPYSSSKGFLVPLKDHGPHKKHDDDHESREDAAHFPLDHVEIKKKYPTTGDLEKHRKAMHMDFGLASIVLQVLTRLDEYSNATNEQRLVWDEAARQSFSEYTSRTMPQHLDLTTKFTFDLGPFDGESVLERYKRVHILFLSLKYFVPASKWKDSKLADLNSCTLFTAKTPIHPQYIPSWMLPKEQEDVKYTPVVSFAPKIFPTRWLKYAGPASSKSLMKEHLEGEESVVVDQGIPLLPKDWHLLVDPRLCSSAGQWRDCIREQYGFYRFYLDIRLITLIWSDGRRQNTYGGTDPLSWEETKAIFCKDDVVIEIRTRIIEQGTTYLPEADGPPQMQSFVRVNAKSGVVAESFSLPFVPADLALAESGNVQISDYNNAVKEARAKAILHGQIVPPSTTKDHGAGHI